MLQHKTKSEWKETVNVFNKAYLSEIKLDDDSYFLDDVISNTSEILEKTNIQDFKDFYEKEKNSFIFDTIKNNSELHLDSIFLLFYLVHKYSFSLGSIWDFDTKILKDICLHSGISTEFKNF